MATGARTLARQLRSADVLLSQIEREVEARAGDARAWLASGPQGTSRPPPTTWPITLYHDDVSAPETQDRIMAREVHVVEYRNAATDSCPLAFLDEHTRFADMART